MLKGTFAYLERDGSDVDQYGKVVIYSPNVKYAERFMEAQLHTRENNKGLWGPIIGKSNSMVYHMPDWEHYNKVITLCFLRQKKQP